MIEKLELRGFQRHKKLELELSPGVVTVVGPNGSGKSTLLRALGWVATNGPRGLHPVGWGAKKARISLTVDGKRVTRSRSKAKNTYSINGRVFKAFGKEPPQEVVDVLNLGRVNLQLQHDKGDGWGPTFWLSLSPAEVSRRLNEVVDLGLIDKTLGKLAEAKRRTSAEQRVVEQRLSEAKTARKRLRWAEKALRELNRLKILRLEVFDSAGRGKALGDLLSTILVHRRRARSLSRMVARGSRVVRDGEATRTLEARTRRLESLLVELDSLHDVGQLPDPGELSSLEESSCGACLRALSLGRLVRELDSVGSELEQAEGEEHRAQQKLTREFKDKVCPICGGRLK